MAQDQSNFEKINPQLNQIVKNVITQNNFTPQGQQQMPIQQQEQQPSASKGELFDQQRMNQSNMQILQQRNQMAGNMGQG